MRWYPEEVLRHRVAAVLSLSGALAASLPAAWAQPVDPYADPAPGPTTPPPPPVVTAPPGADPEVEAAVAQALVARARVLAGEGAYADAKQLVVEALVRAPGDADAKALLVELNARLGIVDAAPLPPPPAVPPSVVPPGEDLLDTPERPVPAHRRPSGFVRYAGGVVGGAVAGGLFADVITGLDDTSEDEVITGVLLGAAAGGLLASALGTAELTRGDHALVDSMAAWGLVGGLTFGLALDPPEGEAYSLNGVFGIAGGYVIGHIAARRTDMSTARLARVNTAALVGAVAPWLLYAATSDDTTSSDEQAFGFLSTAGLLGGVYLGFRWTRGMKPGSEVEEAERGPMALFRHGRSGWRAGGLGLTRPQVGQGAAVTILGGTW